MYSVPEARFEELAAAGFTMVGPYYGPPPPRTLLDHAAATGLAVVYPLGFTSIPEPEELDTELSAQVASVVDHPAIGMWYVLPEELKPWDAQALRYLARIADSVRTHDPHRRPILNYQPNHREAPALATASASLPTVTRGAYTNYVGAREQRAWVRWSAEQLATAATDQRTPWIVLEMFEQPPAERLHMIPTWVRHDVYASLVAGARGILVFSGWPRSGFAAYEDYLAAYSQVATELNGSLGLADPLLRGHALPGPLVQVLDGPAGVRVSTAQRELVYPSVSTKTLLLGGIVWTYLVNSASERVVLQLRDAEPGCPYTSVLGPRIEPRGEVALGPYEIAVLRRPQTDSPATR